MCECRGKAINSKQAGTGARSLNQIAMHKLYAVAKPICELLWGKNNIPRCVVVQLTVKFFDTLPIFFPATRIRDFAQF